MNAIEIYTLEYKGGLKICAFIKMVFDSFITVVITTGKFADSMRKIEVEEAKSTVRSRWAYLKAVAEETQNGTIDSQGAELLAEIIEETASDTISVWRNLRRSAIASEFEKADQSFKSDSHR